MLQHTILITNDDGVEAQGLAELVKGLHDAGYPLIICAPDRERSASTMHLTLHKLLKLRERHLHSHRNPQGTAPNHRYHLLHHRTVDCYRGGHN